MRYPNKKPVTNELIEYRYSYGDIESSNTVKTNEEGDAHFAINTPSENKQIAIKVLNVQYSSLRSIFKFVMV